VLGIDQIMHCDRLIATPINLGSSELISIDDLATMVEEIAGVKLQRTYDLDAPKGVAGRNSDNTFIKACSIGNPAHAAAYRHGKDLRVDRPTVRGPQGGKASGEGLAVQPPTTVAAFTRAAQGRPG
jgi:hypothetical protein